MSHKDRALSYADADADADDSSNGCEDDGSVSLDIFDFSSTQNS